MDRAEEIRSESACLQKADRDIAEGRARLANQQNLVSYLRDRGHQTVEAERLVDLMRQTLLEWERHRLLIVQRLAYLRNEPMQIMVEPPNGEAS